MERIWPTGFANTLVKQIMNKPDIIETISPLTEVFEKLSIPYCIGGSIASSIYGMARATMDVDLVADIRVRHIANLSAALRNKYYFDEDAVSEAVRERSSFNLVHLETIIKIDVFIFKDEPFHKEALKRKRKDVLEEGTGSNEFYFSSPEDIILNKLQWYEAGGRVSERQWLDIIGVMKVQTILLDKDYLRQWAIKLGILELLEKAYQDAGI